MRFINRTEYPTKEQIMQIEQKFKPEVLTMVKEWKKTSWKAAKKNETYRKAALGLLAYLLAKIYNKPVQVEFVSDYPTCYYKPDTQTIFINQSTSIISLLHEFAHHLFGSSELKACRWSVWLFKKAFPRSFNELKWKGHMLIK